MADNSQSTTLLSFDHNMSPSNIIQHEWISEKITKKLYIIAIFNILVGIVIIGLDIGLMVNEDIIFFAGIFSGLYMVCVGILLLVLCRDQLYTLTSFFILLFFQLFFLLLALIILCLSILKTHGSVSYGIYRENNYQKNLIIKNFGLIIILIIFCVTVYSLIVIRKGRRPPASPLTAIYHAHQPMTTENVY